MDKYIEEIQNAIEKAAIDGTLTRDAIGQFNQLIEHNEALQSQAIDFDKKFRRQDTEKKELDAAFAQSSSKLSDFQTRERELVEREQKITVLEMQAKYELTRVEDHKEMFGVVFRNSLIRKEVMTPASSHIETSGASHQTFSDKNTVVEKTE
jgi:hypothetical protein